MAPHTGVSPGIGVNGFIAILNYNVNRSTRVNGCAAVYKGYKVGKRYGIKRQIFVTASTVVTPSHGIKSSTCINVNDVIVAGIGTGAGIFNGPTGHVSFWLGGCNVFSVWRCRDY